MSIRSILAGVFLAIAASQAASAGTCSDKPFPQSLVELSKISRIVPLGNLAPGAGHTIPSRHLYFYPAVPKVEVRAPAGAVIVAAIHYVEPNEWELHLAPCEGVTLYLNHIVDLPADLQAKLGTPVNFLSVDGNDKTLTLSARSAQISVAQNDLLGMAQNFDVGLVDKRKPPLPFANPNRYAPNVSAFLDSQGMSGNGLAAAVASLVLPQALYNRCAIDYFADETAALMRGLLKDAAGTMSAKGCHSHMQDVNGTAQGNWWTGPNPVNSFLKDAAAVSLSNWNADPNVPLFSFNGKAASSIPVGTYQFAVGSATVGGKPSFVNRRFSEINDTALYCYEGVALPQGGAALDGIILLQLEKYRSTIANRMRIELRKDIKSCSKLPQRTVGPGATLLYR